MKYIIAIGDGMADDPVPALGNKTPLQAARTPVMDRLARQGEQGTARTVPQGVAPGSDTAFLSIFGYDPRRYYSGRSPLEAAGSGVALAPGEVSYRCNMVTLEDAALPYEEKRLLSHSGGSVAGGQSAALLAALLADEAFAASAQRHGMAFHAAASFRHIAVQRGADVKGLAAAPPHDHLGAPIGPLLPAGCAAAEGLNEMMRLAHGVLNDHPINRRRRAEGKLPANGIWFWAEGTGIALPSFAGKYGKKGLVVSAVPLVRGIGVLAGLGYMLVDGATGELDTNYEGKADAALAALKEGYDLAVLHVEAPDECTHNGDTPGKLQAIEWFDARALARLWAGLEAMGENYRLLVLSDHKTLTATRGHDGAPVPYILYDSRGVKGPAARPYSEENAARGPRLEEGHRLPEMLFEVAGREQTENA